jgi:hypothetical protein
MRQKENIFEELNRMKYLIKSKPGTVISEQDYGAVSSYAAAGALTGAGMGAGVFSVPGAIIGGAVGAIYGLLSNSSNSEGAKKILQACSNKQTVGPASQSRQQLNTIADSLNAAIEGVGTDENAIKANLQKITTIPDLCAMSTIYQTRHGESLWDALDGDIDEQAEWKNYVYLPLLDAYENSVELGKKVKAAPAGAVAGAGKGAVAGAAKSGGQRAQGGGQSSVNTRFADSAKSLGIQNAKMDMTTLQTMLKSLQGETSTNTPTQETPDIATLTTALNQLK